MNIVEFLSSPVLKKIANGCFYDMLFRHDYSNLAFVRPIFKFLFHNENIKINLKDRESPKEKKDLQFSYIYIYIYI